MFFTKKKSGGVTLVVDIGSSSVGAALVSISKDVAPKILFSTRLPVILQNDSEKGHSLVAVTLALESVMKTIAAEHPNVQKTHIIFSSPWYVSETRIVKIDYDAPTTITHHDIDRLTKEAEKKIIEESHLTGEVIEHRIIRVRLNGYETTNPYNKKAKSMDVAFFASMVAKDVLEPVRRIIGKNFHFRNGEMSSFSLAAFSTMSRILPDEKDFLIVDVRGEVTDLSLITEGALIKSLSFPQGKNALVQTVTSNSGQSGAAASSLINVALHGNSEPMVKTDITKFAETFKQTWLQEYTKTLQEISAGAVVPQTIFLMADPDIEVFFENILNEVKNNSSLHLLKHLNLKDHLEESSVSTDPFLALESIFVTMM